MRLDINASSAKTIIELHEAEARVTDTNEHISDRVRRSLLEISKRDDRPVTQAQLAAVWAHLITVQDAITGVLGLVSSMDDPETRKESREALKKSADSIGKNIHDVVSFLHDGAKE